MLSILPAHGQSRDPLPFAVEAKMPDSFVPAAPAHVALRGWLGARITANAAQRLANVDLEPLLAGYRRKPGAHPWIGEHIGKWMHAATLAWANSGDAHLREMLDYAARELIATQEPDGYLGTYAPGQRFGLFPNADWDVWSHKYCLIGLLTYYQYTGGPEALAAARRAADLLIRTFGPGGRSILSAGTHMGMAATSVLEPIVLLYRLTGDERYLTFARAIVETWNEPGGPRVLDTLTKSGAVNQTANGKAYEMLSNLVGLCELARATGETRYLTPVRNAWEDVVRNQLYITGTASSGEHFHAAHELPNNPEANVGETCVTVTWIQLCSQLLRLTGDAKYADEIERSEYNHLAAAQRPDGGAWCYYTPLEGTKPYGDATNCCLSSGPRGLALAPTAAYLTTERDGAPYIVINTFESSTARLSIPAPPANPATDQSPRRKHAGRPPVCDTREITIVQTSGFPRESAATLTFSLDGPARFGLLLRAPRWARPLIVREFPAAGFDDGGWLVIPACERKDGVALHIDFALESRIVRGAFSNADRFAYTWGPFVLAYDQATNPNGPKPMQFRVPADVHPALKTSAADDVKPSPLTFALPMHGSNGTTDGPALLRTFADAGASGGDFAVWFSRE